VGQPSARLVGGSLLAGAGVVAATTLASRVVGLGRWFVFSHSVGVTCTGQVYATANQVPNLLFEIAAGGALAAVAVPLVAGHLNRGREGAADRTASALLTWALTLLVPLSVLVAVLARPIADGLLGPASCEPSSAPGAAALMLVVFAPQVVLYGVGIVLAGVLHAHRRFLAAALAPLLSSLVVIATYLVYGAVVAPGTPLGETSRGALLLLAGGTTAGVVAMSLPLFWPVHRAGVRWRPTWRFPEGTGARAGGLALAGLVAVGAQQLCLLATIWLTNRAAGVGALNVYTYAQTAYLLPYAVLVVPLATVAFPRLTDPGLARRTLSRTAQAVLVASVAAACTLVAVRREVGEVFLAIDAGADSAGRETLTALPSTLAAYAPGLVGFGLAALLTRALYAHGSPRAAAGSVGAGWLLAALLPLVVLVPGGPHDPGRTLVVLGLGSAVGLTLAGALQVVQVRRAWGQDALPGLLRVGSAALAGGLLGLLLRELAARSWTPQGAGWAVLSALATALLVLVLSLGAVRLVAPATFAAVRDGVTRRVGPD
jgi:putative peptidoglycan lipid II flippase